MGIRFQFWQETSGSRQVLPSHLISMVHLNFQHSKAMQAAFLLDPFNAPPPFKQFVFYWYRIARAIFIVMYTTTTLHRRIPFSDFVFARIWRSSLALQLFSVKLLFPMYLRPIIYNKRLNVLGSVRWLEICTLYNLKCSIKIGSISMMRKRIQRNEVLSCSLGIDVNTCLHQDVVKENSVEEKNAFLTTKMSWLCCANFFPLPSIVHGLFFYAASMGMGVYCFGVMEVANNKIWESKFNKTGLNSCLDPNSCVKLKPFLSRTI